ncbi:MAG: hypothetical protein GX540_08945 [Clostridiales bacterium]|nr:hypothetical protein [Clostridiales bacterium]
MKNEIKVFKNSEFGRVRTITKNGEPWFVGRDVAEALGYGDGNPNSKALTNAIKDHVDEEDKNLIMYEELRGYQNGDLKNFSRYRTQFINESGLYSLIMGSKLPTAKQFKRWVTSEVLPAIRKHGYYGKPPKAQSLLEVVRLVQEARNIMEQQGSTPNEIAETVKCIGEQYGIQFPAFFVKPEETRLNDVFDMIDYIYSQPRGKGIRKPTYEGYVLFKLNEQNKLEGASE